jgi:CRP-like cAMP-binding protein
VKVSVVSKTGQEAVVAMLGPGDIVGEGALTGRPVRIATATAVLTMTALVIETQEMSRVLHEHHALSDRFIAHRLSRHTRVEAELVVRPRRPPLHRRNDPSPHLAGQGAASAIRPHDRSAPARSGHLAQPCGFSANCPTARRGSVVLYCAA